ncbi:MAG: family 43 glycosylhydrolase [Akkermansiaceae bacterium]|nr:family 43 glycosylhydrolase [Akkermansiaceae bacterium]
MKHELRSNPCLLFGPLVAAMLVGCPLAGAAEPVNPAAGQWSEQKAAEWYQHQPWLFGFNFVPSTAVNDTEMWQRETFDPATIDRELAWAEQLGYNSCRVFVQYIVWKADPAGLKDRFTQLLGIADQHHLSVMPVLFDDCAFDANRDPYLGKQDDPVPGTSNARWVPSPGLKLVTDKSAWPELEKYVKDMVGTFGNDPRIVLWDLYNEPGNSGMGNRSLPLVEASFAWARQANPSQPLTISVWGAPKEISDRQVELSDVVSFHFYGDNAGMKERIGSFKSHRRPVICTEWMARTLGAKYETELPLFKEGKVGCYNWGLVNGRTQCQYPWGSPKDAPEPEVWFHDLLRTDGSPKNADEVAFIRRFTNAPGVPRLKPLFDFPVRDTCVCVGPDAYYLIGTTGAPSWWVTNEGIRIWKSKDLKDWEPMGLVWSFAKDLTWQKKQGDRQAIWAPEMHFINGTYWISYCVNYAGTGILKSTSGKPEGPYLDIKEDGPLTGEIDASLFQDVDGKVYFVYQNGKIARMKDDLTGLAGEPRLLKPANAAQVGFEGAYLFRTNDRYYLSCADFTDGRYHCYVASSKNLMGPYGNRYLAIPHGGHNSFFKDKQGNWWSTFFGNDGDAAFKERAAILPVQFGLDGEPRPLPIQPAPPQ